MRPSRSPRAAVSRHFAGLVAVLVVAAGGTAAVWAAASSWQRSLGAGEGGAARPLVVTSITIIADLARQVGGDRIRVHSLLGPGQDPHTYQPTPRDALTVSLADLVLINGHGLDYWAERLVPDTVRSRRLVPLAEGVDGPLLPWPGSHGGTDPHLWMAPALVAGYVEQIQDALVRLDPSGEEVFRRNAAGFVDRLQRLDAWIEGQIALVPPERRKLVTTHDAYRYFGRRYGVEVLDTVWGITTEEEPSAHHLAQLFRNLRQHGVPAFVETTINPQIMEEIAAQAGVAIGGKLYADALGPSGSGAETYEGMMRYNVRVIVDALQEAARSPAR
ncbi:MAG: zinc ABC transporter solute-binding protein [Firmicutes bacterium]|nr:zinc ABC transporter solute-binding protein [Bacillota bacterium]